MALQVRGLKAGVPGHCPAHHFESMVGRAHVVLLLVGGMGRGQEKDLLQAEDLPRLLGRSKVAVVDRIERPSEDPDAHSIVGSVRHRK